MRRLHEDIISLRPDTVGRKGGQSPAASRSARTPPPVALFSTPKFSRPHWHRGESDRQLNEVSALKSNPEITCASSAESSRSGIRTASNTDVGGWKGSSMKNIFMSPRDQISRATRTTGRAHPLRHPFEGVSETQNSRIDNRHRQITPRSTNNRRAGN